MAVTLTLRVFLRWLLDHTPGLTQIEIGRRSDLSHALVNKVLVGTISREPDPISYRKIAETYHTEWRSFMVEHPEHQARLIQLYGWALPESRPRPPIAMDLARALAALERIFGIADGPTRAVMVQQLEGQASWLQGARRAKRR